MEKVLSFEGCNFFRQRLVLSTLSSRPIKITKIREDSDEPGLKGKAPSTCMKMFLFMNRFNIEFEAGFIRLLDKLTNGSRIEVNETGTVVVLQYPMVEG